MSNQRAALSSSVGEVTSAERGRRRWVRHGMSNRWIYHGLASGCSSLPLPLLYGISAVGNTLAIALMRETLGAVRSNLRIALGVNEEEVDRLARGLFYSYGRNTIDLFRTRAGGLKKVPKVASHERDDRVMAKVISSGRGCVLATGHLGSWELGAIFLVQHGFQVVIVGQKELDPEIQALREQIRSGFGIEFIEVGGGAGTGFKVRDAVDRGCIVALLADRPYPDDRVTVDFFGRRAGFLRSPAMLARFCRCPVVPSHVLRLDSGIYRTYFGDPVHADESCAAEQHDARIMGEVARVIEDGIRSQPSQWFNFYDYWAQSES